MTYPPQGYPPQYPQQGYPQQPAPYYPPQNPGYPPQPPYPGYPPQPGYGAPQAAQATPQAPPPPRAQWKGGAAFNAQDTEFEKRPTLSFSDAPVGTTRILINDSNPVVIHGTDYYTKLPAYDRHNEPMWTVGTPFIDENGQKVTFWCGLYSRAAKRMTAARAAKGIGPEDSMIGWVTFIRYIGKDGDARNYEIMVMTPDEARQWMSPAQVASYQEFSIQVRQPGNLECAGKEAAPAPAAPENVAPQQATQPVYTPATQQYGPQGQPGPFGPPQQAPGAAPQQAYAPQQAQPGPVPQGGPFGPPQGNPGQSVYTPQMPPAQPNPFAQGAPNPYAGAPEAMQQAMQTVQQTFPGAQPVPQGPPANDSTFQGYELEALATYANMTDPMIASMGQNPQSVRAAIQGARGAGLLPQGPGSAPAPQGPPGGFPGQQQYIGQDPPF